MREFVCLASIWVCLIVLPGCDLPGTPNPNDVFQRPDAVSDFSQLYRENCSGCHGAAGNLGPAPPLHDPLFLSLVSEAELLEVIARGRPGSPMPPFQQARGGTLTDNQVQILASGIKTHWGTFHTVDDAPSLRNIATGTIDAGARVFAVACAGCHGVDGRGGADGGAINESAFLSLISDNALRRYVITGRPDLGMPNFREKHGRGSEFQSLTNQDVDDLMTFLKSWRAAERRNN